jgi:hypothetical protein
MQANNRRGIPARIIPTPTILTTMQYTIQCALIRGNALIAKSIIDARTSIINSHKQPLPRRHLNNPMLDMNDNHDYDPMNINKIRSQTNHNNRSRPFLHLSRHPALPSILVVILLLLPPLLTMSSAVVDSMLR